ncbi:16712_t:CDS:1, partial [Funneliformis mosseae]
VARLLQPFIMDGNLDFPIMNAETIYRNISYNRPHPRIKLIRMRGILRSLVSATNITTNECAVSRATDMLLGAATVQQRTVLKTLANEVNEIIKSYQ